MKTQTPKRPPPPLVLGAPDDVAQAADAAPGSALTEAIDHYHQQAADARRRLNGREQTLFESDPDRIDKMIALVSVGNYFETAARCCGVTSRSIRGWLQKADEGDVRYQAIAAALETASAVAEAGAVSDVRSAGKNPAFWASAMTFLERRNPDRWGRRQPETAASAPIVVHVHALGADDVQVGITSIPPAPRQLPPIDVE